MSRPLRVEYPGAWYHVMNRGLARKPIVRSDKDRHLFLDLVGETSQIFGIQVHAYSLMDNHYHLLVHTPQAGLSRAMRHLNGLYTQKINRIWKSDGPLFRGRYKALLVESDEYLLELVRYIHLNPVEAGLCVKPISHPWSSHRAYLEKDKRPGWLFVDEVLGRFGSREKQAMNEMARFIEAGVPRKFREDLMNKRVILGTKGFCEWVYHNFIDQEKDEIPLKDRKPNPKVKVRWILDHVSHAYNMPIATLRSGCAGVKNEGREMAVYLARHLSGLSQRDIAKWFGFKDSNAVAQMQYRFKSRLESDKKLRQVTHMLQTSILNNIKT